MKDMIYRGAATAEGSVAVESRCCLTLFRGGISSKGW